MKKNIQQKLLALRKHIKKLDGAIIAFSGGINSTLLLRLAREELGDKAVAVTAISENYPKGDLKITRRIASLLNIKHIIRDHQKIGDNTCMGKFYGELRNMGEREGRPVLSGFHKGDSEENFDFVAARSNGVVSPFLECDLSKAEIRMLAKEFGLPDYEIETGIKKRPTSAGLSGKMKIKKSGSPRSTSASSRLGSIRLK
ncbi:hypothetical protein HY988_06875 [Candidatus Micrarchaeota archaeon]|nr:hypothetical protein [Candidatus Micrarchaeota archaeon]